ncbi:uncharacterized protein BDR25DRAFT_354307 [Lindgomyces ingoldianus]|uniref:Uncharacterized protein n=1 Tax=Lindgomyces ingoldianus TaxID=673940 RepID=A0ACB6QY14_9PLEO|nr:uncharacterized protein BDR25DRAFT_354307 [Lindgomyces ingoldianus]KAF2471811.1 hypothetical protein BDR25DRAFT_354307 [Lindgomyces ingoldianus]
MQPISTILSCIQAASPACPSLSKHAFMATSLHKILTTLNIPSTITLITTLILNPAFITPWTTYRDSYLLHPRFKREGLEKGGEDMDVFFEHVVRELNGRTLKTYRLSRYAGGGRSWNVRLFASLVHNLTVSGAGGFFGAENESGRVWDWTEEEDRERLREICRMLFRVVKHLRGEYAHGHGLLLAEIEERGPCVWLSGDGERGLREESCVSGRSAESDYSEFKVEDEDEDEVDEGVDLLDFEEQDLDLRVDEDDMKTVDDEDGEVDKEVDEDPNRSFKPLYARKFKKEWNDRDSNEPDGENRPETIFFHGDRYGYPQQIAQLNRSQRQNGPKVNPTIANAFSHLANDAVAARRSGDTTAAMKMFGLTPIRARSGPVVVEGEGVAFASSIQEGEALEKTAFRSLFPLRYDDDVRFLDDDYAETEPIENTQISAGATTQNSPSQSLSRYASEDGRFGSQGSVYGDIEPDADTQISADTHEYVVDIQTLNNSPTYLNPVAGTDSDRPSRISQTPPIRDASPLIFDENITILGQPPTTTIFKCPKSQRSTTLDIAALRSSIQIAMSSSRSPPSQAEKSLWPEQISRVNKPRDNSSQLIRSHTQPFEDTSSDEEVIFLHAFTHRISGQPAPPTLIKQEPLDFDSDHTPSPLSLETTITNTPPGPLTPTPQPTCPKNFPAPSSTLQSELKMAAHSARGPFTRLSGENPIVDRSKGEESSEEDDYTDLEFSVNRDVQSEHVEPGMERVDHDLRAVTSTQLIDAASSSTAMQRRKLLLDAGACGAAGNPATYTPIIATSSPSKKSKVIHELHDSDPEEPDIAAQLIKMFPPPPGGKTKCSATQEERVKEVSDEWKKMQLAQDSEGVDLGSGFEDGVGCVLCFLVMYTGVSVVLRSGSYIFDASVNYAMFTFRLLRSSDRLLALLWAKEIKLTVKGS